MSCHRAKASRWSWLQCRKLVVRPSVVAPKNGRLRPVSRSPGSSGFLARLSSPTPSPASLVPPRTREEWLHLSAPDKLPNSSATADCCRYSLRDSRTVWRDRRSTTGCWLRGTASPARASPSLFARPPRRRWLDPKRSISTVSKKVKVPRSYPRQPALLPIQTNSYTAGGVSSLFSFPLPRVLRQFNLIRVESKREKIRLNWERLTISIRGAERQGVLRDFERSRVHLSVPLSTHSESRYAWKSSGIEGPSWATSRSPFPLVYRWRRWLALDSHLPGILFDENQFPDEHNRWNRLRSIRLNPPFYSESSIIDVYISWNIFMMLFIRVLSKILVKMRMCESGKQLEVRRMCWLTKMESWEIDIII